MQLLRVWLYQILSDCVLLYDVSDYHCGTVDPFNLIRRLQTIHRLDYTLSEGKASTSINSVVHIFPRRFDSSQL